MLYNKDNLARAIAQSESLSDIKARAVIDAVFDKISEAMREGLKVNIAKFGIFEKKGVKGRQVRNPRTGEMTDAPAYTKAKFKSAVALKEYLAQK